MAPARAHVHINDEQSVLALSYLSLELETHTVNDRQPK